MSLLIKNGEIVTGDSRYVADIWCEGETITRIDKNIDPPAGAEVIDAAGKYVFPGFIDPHTHIYLPFMGTYSKDTYETGTKAAIAGGTTTIFDMCCPSRTMEPSEGFATWRAQAEGKAACDYTYHMGVTKFDASSEKTAPGNCRREGFSRLKSSSPTRERSASTTASSIRLSRLAKELGVVVTAHCEKRNARFRKTERTA